MPAPISIPETPIAQHFQEPTQEASEDTSDFDTMEVSNHVVQTLLSINEAEVVSLQNWMRYLGYNNFQDLCISFRQNSRICITTVAIMLKVSNVP